MTLIRVIVLFVIFSFATMFSFVHVGLPTIIHLWCDDTSDLFYGGFLFNRHFHFIWISKLLVVHSTRVAHQSIPSKINFSRKKQCFYCFWHTNAQIDLYVYRLFEKQKHSLQINVFKKKHLEYCTLRRAQSIPRNA